MTPLPVAEWSAIARRVIGTPYPWMPGHVVLGPEDTRLVPQERHPAFHGSLDWHSCVHMQWSLATMLDVPRYAAGLGETERAAALRLLRERLVPEHLAVEVDYLRAAPSFERPYGWAWAAQLAARLEGARAPELSRLAPPVRPLADLVGDLVLAWLPRQVHPVRHGKHQNDAFALTLLVDAFARLGRTDVVEACRGRALAWFGDDSEAPTAWEPCGTDFLSPALTEAVLMVRLLGGGDVPVPDAARGWLAEFLPGIGEGRHGHLLAVPEIRDGSDGQLVHLAGLALSRAWALREIAPLLADEAAATVLEAAHRQEQAVLPRIVDGDFMATHWLVSFALLAEGGLRHD